MLRKYTAKLALPAALIIAAPVLAQDPLIEEIVVTATKRPQTLQEVPIAVSVVDSATMERAQVLDIQDLQGLVPSLRVTQLQTSGNTNFLIRGFGNGANNPGIEPSVGVFIDGVYRSRSAAALTDLPNLERVEVLRGPQSTLFGKNASAGVISVTTAAPSLDAYNGSATLTYGNYDQVIAKADINGPLSDTFAWGLSGSYNSRDGYFTNLVNLADKLYHRNINGLVFFNRFYSPDINIKEMKMTSADVFSNPADLRLPLRWVAIVSAVVKDIHLAASTGIHDAEGVAKMLLAGARATQVCSAIYKNGPSHMTAMLDELKTWRIGTS